MRTILFFTILSFHLFSQNKSICATYYVKILNEDNLFKGNSELRNMFNNSIKISSNFEFNLLIDKNSNNSIFYNLDNKNLSNEDRDIIFNRTNLIFAGYLGRIFFFENKYFKESLMLNKNYLIEEETKKEWILTKETKIIDTYLCFKATSLKIVKNVDKIFKHPVVAWYCPNIPLSHGPNGYGGLSGLILELQVRNVVYGIKKLDFNSNEILKIEDFKNKKILTQAEFNDKLNHFNQQ